MTFRSSGRLNWRKPSFTGRMDSKEPCHVREDGELLKVKTSSTPQPQLAHPEPSGLSSNKAMRLWLSAPLFPTSWVSESPAERLRVGGTFNECFSFRISGRPAGILRTAAGVSLVLELSWHVPRLVHSLSYAVEFSAYSSAVTINCVWYQMLRMDHFKGNKRSVDYTVSVSR